MYKADKIKQSSVSDNIRVEILRALETLAGAGGAGLATEATLTTILNNMIASQDIEILMIRDLGGADPTKVYQQIREYDQGTGAWTTRYEDVNGNPYVPVGPVEYIDPSGVLNLILTQLQLLNTGGQLLTEATFVAEDFAQETTQLLVKTVLDNIKIDTGALVVDLAAIETELLAQGLSLDAIETATTGLNTPQTTTVTTNRRTNTTGSPIAAGARSVSVLNAGDVNGSFNGTTIKPGESWTFDADGIRDTLPSFAYDGTGTELVITTVV